MLQKMKTNVQLVSLEPLLKTQTERETTHAHWAALGTNAHTNVMMGIFKSEDMSARTTRRRETPSSIIGTLEVDAFVSAR